MEQPRFGGVALPPLSTSDGEGMSPELVTMEPVRFKTPDSHQVTEERDSETRAANQSPVPEADVQKVMEVLCQLGISTHLERHKLKHERQRDIDLKTCDEGVYCKNLLLKDKKGQAYLIVCGENKTADLHVVKYQLNTHGNLHFASKDSMWNLLHVHPGAVSPLALIHCPGDVRVFMDASLVKSIDQGITKLYFHPLKDDLLIGLTLSQLERFLHHYGTTLEILPSLTSYSAGRRYCNMTGGYHRKHKSKKEQTFRSNPKETRKEDMQEERTEETLHLPQTTDLNDTREQAENTLTKHTGLFQQLGISVKVVAAKQTMGASNVTILPCKAVYLKDKRDNYFLFICHKNQKLDFSTLKMQLKPRKKIVPLDSDELWFLLHIHESKEHPFSLADLKQPQFLVAIADNLHYQQNTVLTFPHPTSANLRLEISLKDLETFINNITHDLITIQVKGNIKEIHALSADSGCSLASAEAKLNKPAKLSEPESKHKNPDGEGHCQLFSDQKVVPASLSEACSNNLFYLLTAPLREWILRCIKSFVQLLIRYLPDQISSVLHQSSFLQRMLTSENISVNVKSSNQNEELPKRLVYMNEERMAKITKLQQLIEQSGIHVDMTETHLQDRFLKDSAERCKTYLLEDGLNRPYFVLCTEDDDPSKQNLRRLRTAFRSRSALQLMNEAGITGLLSWADGSMSWTQEDLNPVAMLDMDLHSLGRVHVGMTGALYSFPDTVLLFDLPPLGVTLRMSCDDLEKMIRKLGFCIVYFP